MCDKMVFCGTKIFQKIIISLVEKMECNQLKFDPRFCKMDCNSYDYIDDPRCLDCEGKHKEEDICINCKNIELPTRFEKEKCCKEEFNDNHSSPDIRFEALLKCCEKDIFKNTFQCSCQNYFTYFR